MESLDLVSRFVPLNQVRGWGESHLAAADIPTARLDAELLLAAVLGMSRARVLARGHTPMRRPARGHFAALIQRRARGEPVAYILGQRAFYGREFRVDRRVLIPRPETEELVDRALDTLEGRPAPRIADIGTGSGAIGVTLAAERPDVRVVATDISSEALSVARDNARRHGVDDQMSFLQGSLLEPLEGPPPFDLIAANLPYVGTDESPQLAPDVRDYEPHVALFAGRDGLDLFPAFFTQLAARPLLAPDGVLLLEIGYAHGAALERMARDLLPAFHVQIHKDLAHHDRIIEIRP